MWCQNVQFIIENLRNRRQLETLIQWFITPKVYPLLGARVNLKNSLIHFAHSFLKFKRGKSAKFGLNFRPSQLWVALVSKENIKTFVTKFGIVRSGATKNARLHGGSKMQGWKWKSRHRTAGVKKRDSKTIIALTCQLLMLYTRLAIHQNTFSRCFPVSCFQHPFGPHPRTYRANCMRTILITLQRRENMLNQQLSNPLLNFAEIWYSD